MKAPKPIFNRILPPQGTHVARVINIIYLGTQYNKKYDTTSPALRITWELPNEKAVFKEGEQPKPFVISREVSHSMGKKSSLRPIVEGVIGVALTDAEAYAFDTDELLGKDCMLTVKHIKDGEETYANVTTVAPLMKGIMCPPPLNDIFVLSFEKWNQDRFDKLPEFIREKIEKSPEYHDLKSGKVDTRVSAEDQKIDPKDIPF